MSERLTSPASSHLNGKRKEEHLSIALNKDIKFKEIQNGLAEFQFVHQALPEINLTDIDIASNLFSRKLKAPLIISPMVGGIDAARRLNRNLAEAAQTLGVGMGVGSQRCAIDDPVSISSYQVRGIAPDILLLANLGAIQLNYGYSVAECQRAVDMLDADALILHLNPLQEALQAEGNTNFAGLLSKIEKVCRALPVPVIVKEVGWGISENVARSLAEVGVAAIDVAGAGGTSWSEVERHRTKSTLGDKVATTFAGWGIPTADSIEMVQKGAPGLTLVASGGIRNGLDVAKVMALGAHAAGIGTPLLKAANISADATIAAIRQIIEELCLTMFCIGTVDLKVLRGTPFLMRKSRG